MVVCMDTLGYQIPNSEPKSVRGILGLHITVIDPSLLLRNFFWVFITRKHVDYCVSLLYTLRVHVLTKHLLGPKASPCIGTSRPKYILFGYMDPSGYVVLTEVFGKSPHSATEATEVRPRSRAI